MHRAFEGALFRFKITKVLLKELATGVLQDMFFFGCHDSSPCLSIEGRRVHELFENVLLVLSFTRLTRIRLRSAEVGVVDGARLDVIDAGYASREGGFAVAIANDDLFHGFFGDFHFLFSFPRFS